jgi:hypothetical protein
MLQVEHSDQGADITTPAYLPGFANGINAYGNRLRGNGESRNRLPYLFRLFPLSFGIFPCYTEVELQMRRSHVLARGDATTKLRACDFSSAERNKDHNKGSR